jgi:alpha-ketoglutarate-dependent taurine dioxygenase
MENPTMSLTFVDLGGHMAAAVEGIDLNQPLHCAAREALHGAVLEKLVLCIRDQALTPKAYLEAMRAFGYPLIRKQVTQHAEIPEINILSPEERDIFGDGKRLVNGAFWHTDDSFKAAPCSLTMLYGVEVPPVGGDTQFANMYAAYDDLTSEMKRRIAGLRVIHKYQSTRTVNPVAMLSAEEMAKVPPVVHPLVPTHPETGRKTLYMNPNRMEAIVGMARKESDQLLDELIAHATQPKYQYRHKWRRGDIVIWDNRCLMHKANADYPDGARRLMYRIIIQGTTPV